MKKTLSIIMALMVVIGIFATFTVGATENTADDALVLHWNFEGDTLEEQLANKAKNGVRTDSLVLLTDGISSSIANGEATIGSPVTEGLDFCLDASTGKGNTLINSVTDGYTLYLRFKVNGQENNTNSPFYVTGSGTLPLRVYLLKGNFVKMRVNNENAKDAGVVDNRMTDDEYVAIAIAVKKNSDNTYTANYYQTYDDWNMFYDSTSITTSETGNKILSTVADFYFGAGNYKGQTSPDYNKTYVYDDIRIYNTCLTQAEVMTINKTETPTPPDTTPDPTPDPEPTPDPDPADNKDGDAAGNKPSDTTADTTEVVTEDEQKKGGCRATVTGAAILIPAVCAVTVMTVKRKKKED